MDTAQLLPDQTFSQATGRHPSTRRPLIDIRELTADDADQVIDVFESLSEFDRYLRFFRPMPSYPSSVLTMLTAMDGQDHVAVGAFVNGTCVGVIRSVRLSRRPTTAEVAVTVSSGYRGLGIARRLMAALTDLAHARGVERFEIDVLPSNRAALALFRSLGFSMRFDSGSLVGNRAVRHDVDQDSHLQAAA